MKRIIAIALLTAATAAAQDDTEDDAWDVNVAFGPTSPLELVVRHFELQSRAIWGAHVYA